MEPSYEHPQSAPMPKAPGTGYPNSVSSTQTMRTRGTKLATKGNKSSTRMG